MTAEMAGKQYPYPIAEVGEKREQQIHQFQKET